MLEIIESAWLRCAPTLTLALPQYVPGLKRYPRHVSTLEALRRGDGERAAAAIRADIESARNDIVPLLERASRTPAAAAAGVTPHVHGCSRAAKLFVITFGSTHSRKPRMTLAMA